MGNLADVPGTLAAKGRMLAKTLLLTSHGSQSLTLRSRIDVVVELLVFLQYQVQVQV